ncbi:MAG: hypothetical protein V1818_02240 [Candidatus Aenigmatarchaeota archaeon]
MENFECWMPDWNYLNKVCKKAVKDMKQHFPTSQNHIALCRL